MDDHPPLTGQTCAGGLDLLFGDVPDVRNALAPNDELDQAAHHFITFLQMAYFAHRSSYPLYPPLILTQQASNP